MASSGVFKFTAIEGSGGSELRWSITSIDYTNLTSNLYWELYATPAGNKTIRYDYGWTYIDNRNVFSTPWGYDGYDCATETLISSGNVTLQHGLDGKKTFTIQATFSETPELYYYPDGWGFWPQDTVSKVVEETVEIDTIPTGAVLISATSFNDETNPTIIYKNDAGNSATSLMACISLDGGASDTIVYRDIPKTGTSYTFPLTATEINTLRASIPNTTSRTVIFYVRSVVGGRTYYSTVESEFTIINCDPVISSVSIYDANSTTAALTGNTNIMVRYESMAVFSYNATAQKSASIVSHYVKNGSNTVSNQYNGVIDDVESGSFIFSATDSRGKTTEIVEEKTLINYVKPTCYQTVKAELSGETGAVVKLKIAGNYFNGSFGAVSNTLKLEVRHTQNDGTMGGWNDLTSVLIPVFNGDTYELNTTISGFTYNQSYTFQVRATDKLNMVQSAQYTVSVMPIFDWNDEDFNFNVPVNINAETLDMNNETILRHSKTTNNTVLSASGGHIYIRPGGTTDTSSEVRITAQGNIEVKGDIMLNGISLLTVLRNAGLL